MPLTAFTAAGSFLWIIIAWIPVTQISGFHIDNQSSAVSDTISMSAHSAAFHFAKEKELKTCRSYHERSLETYLGTYESTQKLINEDKFLLKTCHGCWQFITNSKVNLVDEILDHRNISQLEGACKYLKGDCVENVKTCCENATQCCIKQLNQISTPTGNVCPIIWDGVMCINEADENVTLKFACPTFIPSFSSTEFAEKRCLVNSSHRHSPFWELTDYTNCYVKRIENELLITEIKRYFLIISLCLLLTSIVIFITFKSLRSQQRIKVHINLFVTLLLRCIFELVITVFLIRLYSRMILGNEEKDIFFDTELCNWIIIFLKYFQNSTFNWMLCEALLLYQLLFRTFEHISGIKLYLFIGWCVPFLYTAVYFIIRRFHPNYKNKDPNCWVEELPKLEYLLRGPNILVLLLNIIFLINIIRLIRNLPTQPYDTNYWKRTFKAVLVLVPLFGIQLLLVAFSLPHQNPFYLWYTIIQNIVQDSQGIAVSLAFCAFNQEVIRTLREKVFNVICRSNIRLRHTNNIRFGSRKHDSLNSRSLQRTSDSVPLSIRDSIEQKNKIEKIISEKSYFKKPDVE